MIEVVDRYGQRQPWPWVVANYGDLQVHSFPSSESGWRLVRLKENADLALRDISKKDLKAHTERMQAAGWPVEWGKIEIKGPADDSKTKRVDGILAAAVIMVKVLDINGNPVANQPVCWYWPDAPQQAGCVPTNGLEGGIRPGRYDGPGRTNANGDLGMAMGGGAYYSPPEIGPHAIWPCCPGQYADSVRGFGMLAGTNHFSLWPTFQWVEGGGPTPPECPREEINAILDKTQGRLANIQGDIDAIRALLAAG